MSNSLLSILGTVWINPPTRRSGKWGSTKQEWPEPYYAPKACPGSGYFITGDVIPILRDTIKKVKFVGL